METDLAIGLSAWIIQDGNYEDFAQGDHAAFALEFFAPSKLSVFTPGQEPAVSLSNLGEANYEAIGKVGHVERRWWVVDFGVLAFREESPPLRAAPGDWVRGDIYLGIDPFFYFERLSKIRGAPALIYDWRIKKIEIQTGPFIEAQLRVKYRDPNQVGWKEITKTDAWEDDGGHAEYVLTCECLNHSPRKTLILNADDS